MRFQGDLGFELGSLVTKPGLAAFNSVLLVKHLDPGRFLAAKMLLNKRKTWANFKYYI